MASDLAKSLDEQRKSRWAEIKSMHETLVTENRSAFTADEQVKFDNLHTDLDNVDKRMREVLEEEKRQRDLDESYDAFAGRAVNHSANPESRQFMDNIAAECRAYRESGFSKHSAALSELNFGRWSGTLMNRLSFGQGRPVNPTEARAMAEQRTVTGPYINPGSFTNNSGAGIVPIDFFDQLISYLVEVSGIMQTGPHVLNTQGGEPIQMPYVTQHTGQLTGSNSYANLSAGQGAVLASADPTFGQKTLTANKFGILVQVARELIDDSGVNLLGYLAMSAGRSIGNVVGNQLVNGGVVTQSLIGAGGAPAVVTGSASTAITGSYGGAAVTGAPTYRDLVNLQYSVIAPYRQSKSCYWLAADQTLGTLRTMTDTVGRPIWEPSTILGAPDLLLGKPIVADPFMPAIGANNLSIAFGDFSQFVVRLVDGIRFERSDDFAFGTDLVAFRAIVRADCNLLNPSTTSFPRSQPVVLFKGGQ